MYNINNNFGNLITEFRKSRGLTLDQLGNSIGKTKTTVSKYEKLEIIPDVITILEICNTLNISLSQLFPDQNKLKTKSSKNPFLANKLYLYYYTEDIPITSIIEIKDDYNKCFVTLYNGIKSIKNYASNSSYYYEGTMECDKTIGYMNLSNIESTETQLEKLQLSFNIPWSRNLEITTFFLLGITPNSIPILKKGIISITPIQDISIYNDELLLSNNELQKLKKNNAWILENKNYSNFFFKRKS